jgi:hypothetical protein
MHSCTRLHAAWALICDRKGKVQWAGDQVAALLGHQQGALAGLSLAALMPRPFGPLHERSIREYANQKAAQVSEQQELGLRHAMRWLQVVQPACNTASRMFGCKRHVCKPTMHMDVGMSEEPQPMATPFDAS